MNICEIDKCTGCGACFSVCNKKCIKMEYNEDGFIMPIIDEEKCVLCGKCKKICPVLNNKINNNKIKPITIGCWSKDREIVKNSTSGGIFSELSLYTFKNNGIVVGCIMDERLKTFHSIAYNFDEMKPMRYSKYIQSETGNIYNKVKCFLNEGKSVLFSGTPCQVAALYAVLEGVNKEKLLTVDIICHGVGGRKFFDKYIKEIEMKYNDKVVGICFRDKKNGWRKYTTKFTFKSGKVKWQSALRDSYMTCYLKKAIYRESCYQCKFASLPRVGDITLGDFFGIKEKEISKKIDYDGISVILLNNKKGEYIFRDIKNNLNYHKRPLTEATSTNHNIIMSCKKPEFREKIIKGTENTVDLKNRYCKFKLKVFVARIIGSNNVNIIKRIIGRW